MAHTLSTTDRYGSDWQRLREQVIAREPWCHNPQCMHEVGTPPNPLTVDHVVPLARGGTNDLANLQVLCKRCNSAKGAR